MHDDPPEGFEPTKWARNTDPDTSHEAIPRDITRQCIIVLRAYTDGRSYLDEEAYREVGLIGHQRCTDLRTAGYIERDGRKMTPFGKAAYTCRITTNGRDFLKLFDELDLEGFK